MVLKRILEESGLKEGREYHTQVSRTNGQGKRLRPDCVIELPEDRFVVVDSKVSLTAYRRFSSADGEEERQSHLEDHLQSVRSHVEGLASKDYGSLYGERSPDFALMFMPIEPAFALALQNDESLYQSAFDQDVVIVSPTTLQATTLTIANIWRQERQTQNAREIAERGGRLYDKFVLFAEALEEVGQRIDQAQESYRTVRKRLTDGRGNLLRQIEMLRELGAENSKELPEEMEEDLARANLLEDGEIGSDEQPGSDHSAGDPSGGNSPEEGTWLAEGESFSVQGGQRWRLPRRPKTHAAHENGACEQGSRYVPTQAYFWANGFPLVLEAQTSGALWLRAQVLGCPPVYSLPFSTSRYSFLRLRVVFSFGSGTCARSLPRTGFMLVCCVLKLPWADHSQG